VLAKLYDYIVVDAGNMINSCAVVGAVCGRDTIFLVANPDVPSIRNAQRLVDRVRQLGAGSERVKVLLNRADQHLIAPKQIETALGYGIHHSFTSDYRTVSTALNSGVPLALTNNSEIAGQFGAFTRPSWSRRAASRPKPEPEAQARLFRTSSSRGHTMSPLGQAILPAPTCLAPVAPGAPARGAAPAVHRAARRTCTASCSTA
jgi:hypothetical protein